MTPYEACMERAKRAGIRICKTNADHIRAIADAGDEEIAEYFYDEFCPPEHPMCPTWGTDCKGCWLEWLKQPHEEDDE